MESQSFDSAELSDSWIDGDDTARWRSTAGAVGEGSGSSLLEVPPGCRLPRHTDSAEEILYIVAGQAEAEVGDEHAQVKAGDLAVIPAMVPHGVRNTGDETLRVVGFFSEAEIISTFEEPLQPLGVAQMEQGAPLPA